MRTCDERGAMTEDLRLNFSKRRKLYPGKSDWKLYHENEYHRRDVESPENPESPVAPGTSDWNKRGELNEDRTKSLRSQNQENVDRKSEASREENSSSSGGFHSKEETKEQLELMGSSSETTEEPTSPSPERPSRKISTSAAKMPPAAELEEFFAEAEKLVQKRFAEKYNYDIVKDVPLEGRYQWVRLHP